MAHWVYVLGNYHRMILEVIEAPGIGEADAILFERTGIEFGGKDKEMKKRSASIAVYSPEWGPSAMRSWNEDFLANICSH
jgi:hypothetical protein